MQDAALIGIHRFEHHAAAALLHLGGHAARQRDQSLLALGAVAFRIERDAAVFLAALVDLKGGQILQGIQRLAAVADQDALIIALHVDQQRLFGLGDFKGDGQAHQLRHVLEEFLRADGGSILFRQQQLIRLCADAEETGLRIFQHLDGHAVAVHAELLERGRDRKVNGLAGSGDEFFHILRYSSDFASASCADAFLP